MKALVVIARLPSAGLLSIQLLGVLLYPLMADMPGGSTLFGAFGLVVLAAALRMVRRSPAVAWIAWLLALSILLLLGLSTFVQDTRLAVMTALLEGVFYLYAAGSLIGYMMEDRRASTDELFAAGATFTLLAWAFAHLFHACQLLMPDSFTGAVEPQRLRSWVELLSLSFSTLSGVGMGDVLPLAPMARALVMLEQFAGVMYIALVVSRLIGLTITARR